MRCLTDYLQLGCPPAEGLCTVMQWARLRRRSRLRNAAVNAEPAGPAACAAGHISHVATNGVAACGKRGRKP